MCYNKFKDKFMKLFIVFLSLLILAAGCTETELQRETPSSPASSYESLPR